MTDEKHGWRALALYSWQADHLIDEKTGDPTDEWYWAITHTDMHETEYAGNPATLIRGLIRGMDGKIQSEEAKGFKLLSISISVTKVPIHRSDKKRELRSVKGLKG
jgi:hypothetical protein